MGLLDALKARLMMFAAQAVAIALAEGAHLGAELVADAKDVAQKIVEEVRAEAVVAAGQVEDSFLRLVDQYGALASTLVTDLWQQTNFKGSEKANLAATTLVDAMAKDGVTAEAQHVSALIQNSYLGVKDTINRLAAGAQTAITQDTSAKEAHAAAGGTAGGDST